MQPSGPHAPGRRVSHPTTLPVTPSSAGGPAATVPRVRYRIVPERSQVWIDARSSVHPIRSSTTGLEGWFEGGVDDGGRISLADTPPRAHLELPVALLSSGNELYDREMRRRVDARRFPTIAGDLAEMHELEEKGTYRVSGDVTFHGVTLRAEGEMAVTRPEPSTLRFEGSSVFDIRDFGVRPPRILMLQVYPDVRVRVSIVAERQDLGP